MYDTITLFFTSYFLNCQARITRHDATLLIKDVRSRMAADGIVGNAVRAKMQSLIIDCLTDRAFGTDPRDQDSFVRACICTVVDMQPDVLDGRHGTVRLDLEFMTDHALFKVGTQNSYANDNHPGAGRGKGGPRRKVH